jgi:hypothetical protein
MTVALRTPPITRKRLRGRRTYAGELVGSVLTVQRGAHEVETDKKGEELSRRFDSQRIARVEIGDVLIVEQRTPSSFAALEVGSVVEDGWSRQKYVVRVLRGSASGPCWVLPTKIRGRG